MIKFNPDDADSVTCYTLNKSIIYAQLNEQKPERYTDFEII